MIDETNEKILNLRKRIKIKIESLKEAEEKIYIDNLILGKKVIPLKEYLNK